MRLWKNDFYGLSESLAVVNMSEKILRLLPDSYRGFDQEICFFTIIQQSHYNIFSLQSLDRRYIIRLYVFMSCDTIDVAVKRPRKDFYETRWFAP